MARPRIFVSHSNSDPDSPAYVDALVASLSTANFEVLVDRHRLKVGATWRDEIYTWMGLCHAAVILISEAAIGPASIWVPRETSILLWRRTLDPSFQVIPVFLGGVKPASLKGGVFADLNLEELHALFGTHPEGLATDIASAFSSLHAPKTQLEVLADRLAELLRPLSERALQEAIANSSVALSEYHPIADQRGMLALSLLQTPMRESLPAIEVLTEFLEASKLEQILEMVAPSWVDLCAARWLADCGRRIEDKPAAILNGMSPFCARMYVERAACKPPRTRWPIVHPSGVHGEAAALEIADEVIHALLLEFRLVDESGPTNIRSRLMSLLRERQLAGRPVFASLKDSPAVRLALPELQRMLPWVTFIVLSGRELPESGAFRGVNVRYVQPELAQGAEERAILDFDYVRSVIRP
jgi:hypothetical protein